MPEKAYGLWDKAWQPVVGCAEDLPCAERCWAKRTVNRLAHSPNTKVRAAHEGLVKKVNIDPPHSLRWTGEVRLDADRLLDPMHWRRPYDIATGFHGDWALLPESGIYRIFEVMARRGQHRFFTLTKRPELLLRARRPDNTSWPLPHVWIGVSCSTQAELDERGGPLMQLAAAGWNTFLMLEPLVSEIRVRGYLLSNEATADCACGHGHSFDRCPNYGNVGSCCPERGCKCTAFRRTTGIRLVITGAESGPGSRASCPDWFRRIRDECKAAGVSFVFKGWGDWTPYGNAVVHKYMDVPVGDGTHHRMFRVDKKDAGHLLDGQAYRQLPERA